MYFSAPMVTLVPSNIVGIESQMLHLSCLNYGGYPSATSFTLTIAALWVDVGCVVFR